MSLDHDSLRNLIPAYVRGELDDADRETLDAHLAGGCDECSTAIEEARLELESPLRSEPESSLAAWLPPVAVAALIALAWSGWTQFELRRELHALRGAGTENSGSKSTQKELARAQRHLSRFAAANRILASPELATVHLAGAEAAPKASARVLVTANGRKAVAYVSKLAQAAEDSTYQLWMLVGGRQVPAGTFDTDRKGSASIVLEKLAAQGPIDAWMVTIEPSGGAPQPSGIIVLTGTT